MTADTHSIPQTTPAERPVVVGQRGRALRSLAGRRARAVDHRDEVAARDLLYRVALASADVFAAFVAIVVSIGALGDSNDALRATTFLGIPLVLVASKLQGLYDRDELLIRKSTLEEAPKLFQLATLYTLLIALLQDQLGIGHFGPGQMLACWFALVASTFAARLFSRGLLGKTLRDERCLFIGGPDTWARIEPKLAGLGTQLIGSMSPQGGSTPADRAVDVDRLLGRIGSFRIHRVLIDPQTLPDDEMLDLVRAAKGAGVQVSLLPRVLDVVGSSVVFDDIHGLTVLGVRRFGLPRSSQLLKRAFDLVGATLGLLVLAPAMVCMTIAIRLDSRGAALFRQTRIGRDGRPFRIWKFRTMVTSAEERKAELRAQNDCRGGLFKIADDPRITRVGRFLRRASLDELPQLFNVLAGDMSLVGPRPLVADEDEQITGYDRHRLALTPGMTGQWQVLGSSKVPLPEMVKLDYLYVAGWSLWSDVKILVRTVPYVLARRGL